MEGLEQFIVEYGYWAVLVGTFLEGETLLLLAGFVAEQGLLHLPVVMIVATVGATLGDQFYFYLGRYRREWIFRKLPQLELKAARVYKWVERHPDVLIVISRFFYGFRIVTPIVLGTSRVAAWRYSIFNLLGAVIWSVVISGAGYLLGNLAEQILGDIKKVQHLFILGILAIGFVLWLRHRRKARRIAAEQVRQSIEVESKGDHPT